MYFSHYKSLEFRNVSGSKEKFSRINVNSTAEYCKKRVK